MADPKDAHNNKDKPMNTYVRKYDDGTVSAYNADAPKFSSCDYKTYKVNFYSLQLTEVKPIKNGWVVSGDTHRYYVNDKLIGYTEPNGRPEKRDVDRFVCIPGHKLAFWTDNLTLADAKLMIEKFA